MATKRGSGVGRNGRDSQSKRLGVKNYGGETVKGDGNSVSRISSSKK